MLTFVANVPNVSMKEIAGYEFQSGIDNPGCIVTGIGGKNKFEKFEKLIQLLIEDDSIWVDLYMNARMEEIGMSMNSANTEHFNQCLKSGNYIK